MPELINNLPHRVAVTDSEGRVHKLASGQVKSVDGGAADLLLGIEGVETASSEDKDNYQANKRGVMSDATSGKQSREAAYAEARAQARAINVSVPLNEVIGDNDAPLGPPSGVITTKQAVAGLGPEEKRAYADHERLPHEAEDEGLSPVERAQAAAKAKLAELHEGLLNEQAEAGNESVDLEPKSVGTLASSEQKQTRRGRKSKDEQQDATTPEQQA